VQIGIMGLKFTGKTTLYNAITGADMPTGQGGVDAHRAVGKVPDARLEVLSEMFNPKKTVHASVEWVDIPGFDASGHGGTGDSNKFLEHARKVDAIAHVVRCFDNGMDLPDPEGEIESIALELQLADLQIVENRLERLNNDKARKGKYDNPHEPPLFERFLEQLESGQPLHKLELNEDEIKLSSGFSFLTLKPVIIVLNSDEEGVTEDLIKSAQTQASEVVDLCAKVEEELGELDEEERNEFLADLGITEPASARMVRSAYSALGLHSFFTVGEDECRAWAVRKGALAPEAAGAIHSDLQRGFIRAETCSYDHLIEAGGLAEVKKENNMRLEGKQYEVKDGDIVNIRFSV
jgi:ribosome-binding ATPase